jgi:hypothetical protein
MNGDDSRVGNLRVLEQGRLDLVPLFEDGDEFP